MQLQRFIISALGLLFGIAVYSVLNRLGHPWNGLATVAFYLILAAAAWKQAAGDKLIRGVAIGLAVFAVVRLVLVFV